jgi:hypothetical protein
MRAQSYRKFDFLKLMEPLLGLQQCFYPRGSQSKDWQHNKARVTSALAISQQPSWRRS